MKMLILETIKTQYLVDSPNIAKPKFLGYFNNHALNLCLGHENILLWLNLHLFQAEKTMYTTYVYNCFNIYS